MLPVAGTWFSRESFGHDVTLITEPHVVPLLRCNIWHVRGRDRDLMVDTGLGVQSLREFARDIVDKPVTAVATHVHIDHIGCHHEFDECLVHECEYAGLVDPSRNSSLAGVTFDPNDIATLLIPPIDGYALSGPMITALPHAGYDLEQFQTRPATNATSIAEGYVIDLGNRALEVMHLPGHSPGSIGLWEAQTSTLFSGDTIYDGPLIDSLHHSDIESYIHTFERLLELPVEVVHAGHDPSFGRDRFRELITQYLKRWQA